MGSRGRGAHRGASAVGRAACGSRVRGGRRRERVAPRLHARLAGHGRRAGVARAAHHRLEAAGAGRVRVVGTDVGRHDYRAPPPRRTAMMRRSSSSPPAGPPGPASPARPAGRKDGEEAPPAVTAVPAPNRAAPGLAVERFAVKIGLRKGRAAAVPGRAKDAAPPPPPPARLKIGPGDGGGGTGGTGNWRSGASSPASGGGA